MMPFPLSKPPALVLFDCDGVLVDSEPIANPVFTAHINAAGIKMDVEEVMRRFVGMSLPDCVDLLNKEFDLSLGPDWIKELRADTDEAFRKELTAIPGANDAVQAVASSGIPFCVASSGSIEKMDITLGMTGMLEHFTGRMFTAWDVAHGKPWPDLFLHAAKTMGAAPATCVVIEDSVPGVKAGISAGMQVLAYVPDGNAQKFRDLGACPFQDMAEIPALLGIEKP